MAKLPWCLAVISALLSGTAASLQGADNPSITFLPSYTAPGHRLSQQSSTLNLRTLQQNSVSPAHTLIFRAGSTYTSSPPAKPSFWAWAVVRNVHFCSNYLLLLQQPTSPHPKLGWVLNFSHSFSISGSNPSPGAESPSLYWWCSWRTGFQPLSHPATLYAKNDI